MTDIMDLIDAYVEARHRCGCAAYNAQTAEARRRVTDYIESIGAGGMQSLRAPGVVALADVLRKLDNTLGPGNVATAAISRHFSTGTSVDQAPVAINSGASSGVQTLSAAPAVPAGWVERWHGSGGKEFWEGWSILNAANREMIAHLGPDVDHDAVRDIVAAHNEALCGECAGTGGRWCPACAGATPPAEQQATKETSGGFHVWRDISTAPKDGSRFVATGHNYGLYSEVRHTCVAQWFRGCWMEASDWNETSELKYLTHWMPLPSPPDDVAAPADQQAPKAAPVVWLSSKQLRGVTALHGQYLPFRCQPEGRFDTPVYLVEAAPKAAPGEPVAWRISCPNEPDLGFWLAEEDGGEGFLSEPLYTRTAPQAAGQDARPCHVFTVRKAGGLTEWEPTTMALALPDGAHALYTLPQPSPHAQADSVTAPAVASEPIAYLYDDGSWTPAKTEEGHKLNNWMISAGSPKIGVHLASAAPLTTLTQATQVGNQQEAQEPAAYIHVPHHTVEGKVHPVVSFEKYQQDYADGIYSTRIPLYTAPQQEAPLMPKGESAASKLRAMAANYPEGHLWDKLDSQACAQGAMEIEALRAAPQQEAQEPVFCSYCGGNDETPQEHCTDCLRPVPAKARIREIFLANGFTIKEGQADLKQYVYDAAYALLSEAPQPAPAPLSDDVVKDAARYRWLRGRLPGGAYRIAGVIYSEGGAGVDAAIDAAMASRPQ